VTLHRDGLRLRFYTSIPSTRSAISAVAERVREEVADRPGFADDDMTNVEIALREGIANAIIHGNENDPSKKVLVSCYMEPGHGVLIAIQDEGKGFDPGSVPDPREAERIHLHHGRGIFLMRQLMDRVEHRNGGREVILLKRPSGEHKLEKKKPSADDDKD
jgi:serine/threonine-protein kinase RsbW